MGNGTCWEQGNEVSPPRPPANQLPGPGYVIEGLRTNFLIHQRLGGGRVTSLSGMNLPDTGLVNQEFGVFISRSTVSVSAKKYCSALG